METKYLKQLANEFKAKPVWNKDEIEGKFARKIEQASREEERPKVENIQIYDFVRVMLHGISHPCVIFR